MDRSAKAHIDWDRNEEEDHVICVEDSSLSSEWSDFVELLGSESGIV
jgi:hypothetical protein